MFAEVDENEVILEIEKLPNKQCFSNPIPTCLLKKIYRLISPFLTNVYQFLFCGFCFSLLKKPSLDTNDVSFFKPISNFSVLNKLLERLVLARLSSYLTENKLFPSLQSAYRPHHSTETAISKIYSDILKAADNGELSLLVLLYLSSAFDLVDHDILLRMLDKSFGFRDVVLKSFTSYLTNRTYYQML